MWNRAADKIVIFSAGFFLDLIFGDPYWMPHGKIDKRDRESAAGRRGRERER